MIRVLSFLNILKYLIIADDVARILKQYEYG